MVIFHFRIHSHFRNCLLGKMDEINVMQKKSFSVDTDYMGDIKWAYIKSPGFCSKGRGTDKLQEGVRLEWILRIHFRPCTMRVSLLPLPAMMG